MPGMDLMCPSLRAKLEGRPPRRSYPYDMGSSGKENSNYGKMGVEIKLLTCTEEEAHAMIRAALGNKLVGDLYRPDGKK